MSALAALAAVGLDELQESAALQTRVDRKYLVPDTFVDTLLERVDGAVRVLDIDGQRSFAYESVYFDTPALASYLGAAHRRRRRFKVRTRTYVDSGQCWVEVKTRGTRGTTVKNRAPHPLDARTTLDDGALGFTAQALDDARVREIDGGMVPTLLSTYDRVTLHVPASLGSGRPDSRTTIDTGLVWTDVASGARHALGGWAVVETKTGSTPSATDRLLWEAGHRPVRISKYGTGMAVLHPELPATPWRRVLRRHVTT